MTRPIPMIDDLTLDAVSWARHTARQRVVSVPVVGLEGDVQQRLGRASHLVEIRGVVTGEEAKDKLADLQEKTASGEEVVFTADITTALSLEQVVVLEAEFEEHASHPGLFSYRLLLRESPPLPEPAELSPFGGLGGFDLGFDTDILGDILDQAGALQDAMELANDALGALEALANLPNLPDGNPLEPIRSEAAKLGGVGERTGSAVASLSRILGGV